MLTLNLVMSEWYDVSHIPTVNVADINRATEPQSHRATATEAQSHRATEPQSHRATEPQRHRATESGDDLVLSVPVSSWSWDFITCTPKCLHCFMWLKQVYVIFFQYNLGFTDNEQLNCVGVCDCVSLIRKVPRLGIHHYRAYQN